MTGRPPLPPGQRKEWFATRLSQQEQDALDSLRKDGQNRHEVIRSLIREAAERQKKDA